MKLNVFADSNAAIQALADYFVALAGQAIAARGRCVVALSGGSSPKRLYELLASAAYHEQVAWEQVYFFFGDERNVPHTSADSNYRMAKKALLDPLGIRPAQVFAVDTDEEPGEAAAQYGVAIEEFFGERKARFDLVLLGLGDNAHTASLFPHTAILQDKAVGVKEVWLADQQVYRISFTAPLINQARAIAFLVFGADKAVAVAQVLGTEQNSEQYPAQLIAPGSGEVQWFLDEAAAGELEQKGV